VFLLLLIFQGISAQECADSVESNNSEESAIDLNPLQVLNSLFCSPEDIDWYKITINQPQAMKISVSMPSAIYNMTIFPPNSTSINYLSSNSRNFYVRTGDAGTTYVSMSSRSHESSSFPIRYRVSLELLTACNPDISEPDDDFSLAKTFQLDSTQSLTLCSNDRDFFAVPILEKPINASISLHFEQIILQTSIQLFLYSSGH